MAFDGRGFDASKHCFAIYAIVPYWLESADDSIIISYILVIKYCDRNSTSEWWSFWMVFVELDTLRSGTLRRAICISIMSVSYEVQSRVHIPRCIHWLSKLTRNLNMLKFSKVFFSGIDAPGTTFVEIAVACQVMMMMREADAGRPIPAGLNMQQCQFHMEWDRLCQEELMIHPHSSCSSCCFGNLSSL